MKSIAAKSTDDKRVRLRPWLSACAAALVLCSTVTPGIATAAPDDALSLADSPTLDLRTLGVDPTIAFYGPQSSQVLTIPVPPGLVPTQLVATVNLPVDVQGGTLDVSQDERPVARVPLPADQGRVVIPLTGARIVDNAVTVRVDSRLTLAEGACRYDSTNPLRLIDGDVNYSGREIPPAAVADFLPPVLDKLTLFVPPEPDQAESDAAVRLATAVAAEYGLQRPVIDLVADDGAPVPPPQPRERQIVIRTSDAAGLTLQGPNSIPALVVSGPPGEITNQARLLSSDISKLAIRSKAVVGPLSRTPQLPGDLTTIRKLGQPGVNATALVNPRVTIPLDQTRLGRSVRGVRVHLRGFYTPLPETLAGQVVVTVAGQAIDRWPTDRDGRIDRWIEVPDTDLQRYTSLTVEIDAAGNTGRCGEFQPLTLTVDGETEVETRAANPPVVEGFQAMPQALMPRIEVGMDDGFANLRRAVLILTGLQRLSSRPFDTEVRPLDDVISSANPAVLISPTGWRDDRIPLPVAVESDGVVRIENADDSGEPTTLTLDPSIGFGSLQTTYAGGRSVLVATSAEAPEELDRLLGWLDADTARWSGLSGDAVVAAPGREPVELTTPAAQQQPSAPSNRTALYLAISAGVLLLAGVGAVVAVGRSRRAEGRK